MEQIARKGMSVEKVEKQLKEIENGFPFIKIDAAAAVGKGILRVEGADRDTYTRYWNAYVKEGHRIEKFVPASGAASRMFKNLFAFLEAPYDVPTTDFEKCFFDNIKKFAFRKKLCEKCKTNDGMSVCELIENGRYKDVVANLLLPKGLNYGALPKGLLLFHEYEDRMRTPMEEHLVEAALYAQSEGVAHVHFTVSHEHLALFETMVKENLPYYENKCNVKYDVTFSEQKPETDTISANADNTPFRLANGDLLFRPGGHGALIENLNDISADVVFIKNIDNVVPDRLKPVTTENKKMLAGILVSLQKQVFSYLRQLDKGEYTNEDLTKMIRFLQRDLCCRKNDIKQLEDAELAIYLKNKLNRPIRVCGVVKNVGEPGGGPFLCYNADGTVSLQILESSQIDKKNASYVEMFTKGTHFNPVDLVCAVKDYKGNHFDLPKYVDPTTGFISSKSKNGRELKALELPGLWNGAMSNWNTVFVEVPVETFNPVKTVNDLLRPQHQPDVVYSGH